MRFDTLPGLPKNPAAQRYLFFFMASVALMLALPRPYSTWMLAGTVAGSLGVLGRQRLWPWLRHIELPSLPVLSARQMRWLYAAEVVLVLGVLWGATSSLRVWSPDLRIWGIEFSYLINSGLIASRIFDMSGSIPLWNPLMGYGEPLLENPFSFVLNPLMTLPIFGLGWQDGTKLAVVIHALLMGLGGWGLAFVLGLRRPGRLLLALVLGSSGSMIAAIGDGFYQMSLSQAYVPWIYMGLWGTIRRDDRWPVGVLAVATSLMMFAGTFWYVLPTAISCVVVLVFALPLRRPAIKRLFWAGLLLFGLSAVRLLPQIIHYDLIFHPVNLLKEEPRSFMLMMGQFFRETGIEGMTNRVIFYHYMLPGTFAALLVAARLAIWRTARLHWRIVVPALLLLSFFTAWSQGGTSWLRSLYEAVPLLRQWRFEARMLAAASPWLAVLAALWFDQVIDFLRQRTAESQGRSRLAGLVFLALALTSILWVGHTAVEKWRTETRLHPAREHLGAGLHYLRREHPQEFLPVLTPGFHRYLTFYDTLTRASFGNPDYKPRGLPSTLGERKQMNFPPEYAFETPENFLYDPAERGYETLPGTEDMFRSRVIWENPTVPTYAFLVPIQRLEFNSNTLTRADVQPVRSFEHQFDRIVVTLEQHRQGQVLVLQETAYPGWKVRINGRPVALESVAGWLGVILPSQPADQGVTQVVFSYEPDWLYVGSLITVISVVITAIYLLRLTRWLPRPVIFVELVPFSGKIGLQAIRAAGRKLVNLRLR
jgi:hypothetical protein